MRLLYDREQVTARLVVKSREDLETPLVSSRHPYACPRILWHLELITV